MEYCADRPTQLLVITVEPSHSHGWTVKAIHLHEDEIKPKCPRDIIHNLDEHEMLDYVDCLLSVWKPRTVGGGVPQRLPFC